MKNKERIEWSLPRENPTGSQPTRLRILGGLGSESLHELAIVELKTDTGSPWHEVKLKQPTWLRYLKIEVLEIADPGAPFVSFTEVEAYGVGLSAARPVHRVWYDEHNNITVDGKPFFPIYLYNTKADTRLPEFGFNSTIQTYDVRSDTARLAVLDKAYDFGYMVLGHVPFVETEADRKRARNQLLAARHHPALLGFLMSDEAGHSKEVMEKDKRRAEFIHQYDSNHFTMLNDLYPQNYPRSSAFVDVFSIDPYPHIVGQPWTYQGHAIDVAYDCVKHKKPVFVVNASWGWIVSPVENRISTYLALIHGAKGISWYAVGVRYLDMDHWGSILRCVQEIHRLKPVLFAPDTPADSPLRTHTKIENPSSRFDVMIKQVGDEVWMLAANCEPREAKVRFSFGWADQITIKEVMTEHPQAWAMQRSDFTLMDKWPPSEDREPVRRARPIELTFDPLEVRIFRMLPAGKIAPLHEPVIEGSQLAMINESIQNQVAEQAKKLREENKPDQAKQMINDFWAKYGGWVTADDFAALMDLLSEDASADDILTDYGKLADEFPEAENWAKWVYKIVVALVEKGRTQEAQQWVGRLVEHRPDSLWRANAEVLVNPASAREGHKPWTVARKLNDKPVIDGELDEAVWKERVTFKNTVFLDESKRPQDTEFAVAYDDEALYIAVRLIEPEPSKILARHDLDHDDRNIWDDDSIVIYFDPKLDYFSYQQFVFNSLGTKWDGTGNTRGRSRKGALNAEIERKTLVKDDAWQIEMRMPFEQLGLKPPQAGQVWGLGLQRWRHVTGALPTVWGNERGTSHDRQPENFGFLVFE